MDKFEIDDNPNQWRDDLRSLADTLDDLLNSPADQTPEQIDELKAKAKDMLKDARKRLMSDDNVQQIVSKTKDFAHQAHEYAHKNPWGCAGFTAAAGLLVGILLARR